MSEAALDVHELCFRRGRQDVLLEVTLSVTAGDFVSIVGPNGVGKTTLLKCLMRILTPSSGRVTVLGKELPAYHQRELARHMSYLPQSDHRVPPFTVYEYVMLGRYPHLSPFSRISAADEAVVQTVMDRIGVSAWKDRDLHSLSGGERQKVLIAAALAQGAEILLLDEPASFLDPKHQQEVFRTLGQLNADGVTIVMVTHDINSAALHSRSIVALQHGTVEFSGASEAFMQADVLRRVFDIDARFVDHPQNGRRLLIPEGHA
jgi:iron complex transport system ATP-binding protein